MKFNKMRLFLLRNKLGSMTMKRGLKGRFIVLVLILFHMVALSQAQMKDYKDDSLAVTEKVREFVERYDIRGSDLEIVQKIIRLTHDELLFIKVDRSRIQSWIESPEEAEEFRIYLEWLTNALEYLNKLRSLWPLSHEETVNREDLSKQIFYGEHDLRVFEDVIKKKNIYSKDLPFAVSGAEAVEFGIRDGCTTFTKTFIVLAKAAGLEEIRAVTSGCTSDYNRACPFEGVERDPGVTINGHWFALVKIEGEWALVNCTYFNPYASLESDRYEIFFTLDGEEVSPANLMLKVLKIPSFQEQGICQNRLYVEGVGVDKDDDLDVENFEAKMNLAVSGDRECRICLYSQFTAVLFGLNMPY